MKRVGYLYTLVVAAFLTGLFDLYRRDPDARPLWFWIATAAVVVIGLAWSIALSRRGDSRSGD